MMAVGYTTRYGGLDAAMGLAFARTGGLYPIFGTMLGWLGVALPLLVHWLVRFRLLGEDQMVKVGADYTRGHFIDRRVRNGGMTWLPIRTGAFDPAVPATWTHTSASFMPTEWGGEVDLDAEVVNAAGYAQAAFSVGLSHDAPQTYLYVADGGTHVITVLRRSDRRRGRSCAGLRARRERG